MPKCQTGPVPKWFSIFLLTLFLLPLASAADIAYILEDASQVSIIITSILNNQGLTYDIIRDSQIQSTNFNQYSILLITEDVDKLNYLPLNQKSAIFLSRDIAETIWASADTSQSNALSLKFEQLGTPFTEGFTEVDFNAYTLSKEIYYLSLKPSYVKKIAYALGSNSFGKAVIAYSEQNEIKNVFFGLPETNYWTPSTKQIFTNALIWLNQGAIECNSNIDCDDANPDTEDICHEPATEDSYCTNNLIPNNPPTLTQQIPPIAWGQGLTSELLDLNNYFEDLDNDELTFGVEDTSPNTEITVTQISNSVFLFESEPLFTGEDWIIFYADDGEDQTPTNIIILTVIPIDNLPPTFLPLTCTTQIDEDTQETCILEATDINPEDTLTFKVESQTNLVCEIEDNILTYTPEENYNGPAECTLTVSDGELTDSQTLNINIQPINDAPEIISYTPTENIIDLFEGQSQIFSLETQDIDSSTTIKWFLDDVLKLTTSASSSQYTFLQNPGIYLLYAIVSDGSLTAEQTWSIIVGNIEDYTCEEVNGYITAESEVCRGELLNVKDFPDTCCSIQPEPQFNDADTCSQINNSIEIEIDEPEESNKIELGDELIVRLDITNNLNEDKYMDVEVYIYDLTEDKIVEEDTANIEITERNSRELRFDLTIPEDLDTNNKYAIMARAFLEDDENICNQVYKKIEIKRPDENVIISKFNLPSTATCGQTVNAEIKIENLGNKDQQAALSIKNKDLDISETSDSFTIDKYEDSDDTKTTTFLLAIPQDAEAGTYTLTATLSYNSKRETLTKEITVQCNSQEPNTVFTSQTISTAQDQINLNNTQTVVTSQPAKSKTLLYVMLLSNMSLIIVSFLSYFFFLPAK